MLKNVVYDCLPWQWCFVEASFQFFTREWKITLLAIYPLKPTKCFSRITFYKKVLLTSNFEQWFTVKLLMLWIYHQYLNIFKKYVLKSKYPLKPTKIKAKNHKIWPLLTAYLRWGIQFWCCVVIQWFKYLLEIHSHNKIFQDFMSIMQLRVVFSSRRLRKAKTFIIFIFDLCF